MNAHDHSPDPVLDLELAIEERHRARVARRKASSHSGLPMLALNMTPMIDCVFLLLIFFILTLDFRPIEDALSLDTPERLQGSSTPPPAADPLTLPPRPVIITVRSTGSGRDDYTLSTDEPVLGSPSSVRDLEQRARASRGNTLPDSQLFSVKPAPDARWEHALAAFNALQRAGFRQITLANPSR